MSCGINPYLRRRLSWNSSQENSVPLRRWGIALNHAPFLISLWRRFLSWPPASSFRLARSPSSMCIFSRLAAKLALCVHALWPTQLSAELPKRESTGSPLATLEVFYALSADIWGSGIPNPPCLTLWPRIFRKSALISSPRIAWGVISLLGPPQWYPLECQLWGHSFAGTATRVATTFPSRRKTTGGAVGLFELKL